MFKSILLFLPLAAGLLFAQTKPEPDTLTLKDGEKLIGHMVSADGANVVFKSDLLGSLTVAWANVTELKAAEQFAVVPKGVKITRKTEDSAVPQGTITADGKNLTVGGSKQVAVADTANVVAEDSYKHAVESSPSLMKGWTGAATLGLSIMQATQQSRTLTDGISLVRVVPGENWLARRNRTTVDFASTFGTQSQPGTADIKTQIFHAGLERDEYFSHAAYGFGQAQYDHNFSQGLDLQQTYVGGLGWTVIQKPNSSLDLKAGFSYVRQQFAANAMGNNLAGSVFNEIYARKIGKGIALTQTLTFSPSWTNSQAWSALYTTTLAMPVYKNLALTTSTSDSYLNNPPGGFKKNSFQFSTGVTYLLK